MHVYFTSVFDKEIKKIADRFSEKERENLSRWIARLYGFLNKVSTTDEVRLEFGNNFKKIKQSDKLWEFRKIVNRKALRLFAVIYPDKEAVCFVGIVIKKKNALSASTLASLRNRGCMEVDK